VIYLDADAAGHGWFLDPTPRGDSEFAPGRAHSPAAGRVDLLTVLAHEMGHVLGLGDDHAADPVTGSVMAAALPVGVRRTHRDGLLPEAPPTGRTPHVPEAAPVSIFWMDSDTAGWGRPHDPAPTGGAEFSTPLNEGEANRADPRAVRVPAVGR